jgi:hypothetical protein
MYKKQLAFICPLFFFFKVFASDPVTEVSISGNTETSLSCWVVPCLLDFWIFQR